jgi:hypothetical protein
VNHFKEVLKIPNEDERRSGRIRTINGIIGDREIEATETRHLLGSSSRNEVVTQKDSFSGMVLM